LQGSTKTDEIYEKYIPDSLLPVLTQYLSEKNLAPGDFVFYRSEHDRRPINPEYLRRDVLYPALQRAGVERVSRASGFHAFRRQWAQQSPRRLDLSSPQCSCRTRT
jgi:hypothetical protein